MGPVSEVFSARTIQQYSGLHSSEIDMFSRVEILIMLFACLSVFIGKNNFGFLYLFCVKKVLFLPVLTDQ